MSSPSAAMRSFTISLPEPIADQLERAAATEQHTVSEVLGNAYRAYSIQRSLAALDKLVAMSEAAPSTEYGPEDVERLVDEVRAEMAAERAQKAAA